MPLRLHALALMAWTTASLALGGESFPYRAYINANEVYLRSGPGQNYYPTEKLHYGAEVEVWRHDPGGWYALRPTASSFSWVSAEFLSPTDDGLAEVIGDRVVVRVGSDFSDVRDVIQIHLNRGEEVEVLEAKRFGAGPAAQTWYKIAPPAGEFRWVHGKYVDRDLAPTEDRRRQPSRNRLIRDDDDYARDEIDDESAERDSARQAGYTEPQDEDGGGFRSRGRYDDGVAPINEDELDADHESSDEHKPDRRGALPATSSSTGVGTRTQRAQELDRELDDLNLALSRMVSEEPTAWSFGELREQAEAALERGSTAIQRGRARLILSKIDRFEDVKRRTQDLEEAITETERLETIASARARRTASPRFDGVGRLARVRSRTPGVPSYALTDPAGAVRYYVTPAPGVNLQNYVGREIGVSGSVGYIPELKGRSVTAQRVMPLDDRRWR